MQELLNDKSHYLEQLATHVKNECIEKSSILDDNERLDDIIERLERRNQELSQMLGDKMYKHAENFKNKVFTKLSEGNVPKEPSRNKHEVSKYTTTSQSD